MERAYVYRGEVILHFSPVHVLELFKHDADGSMTVYSGGHEGAVRWLENESDSSSPLTRIESFPSSIISNEVTKVSMLPQFHLFVFATEGPGKDAVVVCREERLIIFPELPILQAVSVAPSGDYCLVSYAEVLYMIDFFWESTKVSLDCACRVITFFRNGQFLTGHEDGSIVFWRDLKTPAGTFRHPRGRPVRGLLVLDHDSMTFLSCSFDGTIMQSNITNGVSSVVQRSPTGHGCTQLFAMKADEEGIEVLVATDGKYAFTIWKPYCDPDGWNQGEMIALPAQVTSACRLPSGDLIIGCEDGIGYVFTDDRSRAADPERRAVFDDIMSRVVRPLPRPSSIEWTRRPEWPKSPRTILFYFPGHERIAFSTEEDPVRNLSTYLRNCGALEVILDGCVAEAVEQVTGMKVSELGVSDAYDGFCENFRTPKLLSLVSVDDTAIIQGQDTSFVAREECFRHAGDTLQLLVFHNLMKDKCRSLGIPIDSWKDVKDKQTREQFAMMEKSGRKGYAFPDPRIDRTKIITILKQTTDPVVKFHAKSLVHAIEVSHHPKNITKGHIRALDEVLRRAEDRTSRLAILDVCQSFASKIGFFELIPRKMIELLQEAFESREFPITSSIPDAALHIFLLSFAANAMTVDEHASLVCPLFDSSDVLLILTRVLATQNDNVFAKLFNFVGRFVASSIKRGVFETDPLDVKETLFELSDRIIQRGNRIQQDCDARAWIIAVRNFIIHLGVSKAKLSGELLFTLYTYPTPQDPIVFESWRELRRKLWNID